MTKKGELIVEEIDMGRGPISPVLVDVGTVHIQEVPSTQGPFMLTQVCQSGF